ncbi:MAG TPA: hypothetical protein VFH70_03740 [Acidimicrobiales bacterium]|nr:hypothetical protein [Acidimicrobiales bacterium]
MIRTITAAGAALAGCALWITPALADYGVGSGGSQTGSPGATSPNPLALSGCSPGGPTTGTGVTVQRGACVTVSQASGGCPPESPVAVFVVMLSSAGMAPTPTQVNSGTVDSLGGFTSTFNAPSLPGPYPVFSSCGSPILIATAALSVVPALSTGTGAPTTLRVGSGSAAGRPATFAVASRWGTPELRAAVDQAVDQEIITDNTTSAGAQRPTSGGSGGSAAAAAVGTTGPLALARAQRSDLAAAEAVGLVVTASLMVLRRRRGSRRRWQ